MNLDNLSHAHYIVTHPGEAHRDDFLSCCLLVAIIDLKTDRALHIRRRDPRQADLESLEVVVLDVGGQHEPARNNYDHHQLTAADADDCAFVLILKELGLYEAALKRWPKWLPLLTLSDCHGAKKACTRLGYDPEHAPAFYGVDRWLVDWFGQHTEIDPMDPIYEAMKAVGGLMLKEIDGSEEREEARCLEKCLWISSVPGGPEDVFWYVGTKEEFNLHAFRAVSLNQPTRPAITVSPNQRGEGVGLFRLDEQKDNYDFSRCRGMAGVEFTHNNGFFAVINPGTQEAIRRVIYWAKIPATEVLN